APGVGLPRVPLGLEAGLVDAGVAGHAPVDTRDRLVEVVAVELLEHELLDLGDLRLPVEAAERRAGLRPGEVTERHALELLLQIVARGGELRELLFGRLDRSLERLDLVLQVLDVRLRLAVDLLALDAHLLLLLDLVQQRLGRAAVVERVVVLEAQLLELALDEAEAEVLVLVLLLRRAQRALQLGDLARALARRDALAGLVERLGGGLVLRVGVETLLLVRDRVLQAGDLEPVELRLPLLPRPAEDVVVGDRPQRADEEEERGDEPERPVGALLLVEDGSLPRHQRIMLSARGSAPGRRTRARRAPGRAPS